MEQYNQVQQYQQPQYQQRPYQQQMPYNTQASAIDTHFVSNIVQSIIQMLFIPLLYGVIPLIFTLIAHSSWKHGDYEDYNNKTKYAKRALIIGWIIWGLYMAFVFGYFIILFYGMVTSGF